MDLTKIKDWTDRTINVVHVTLNYKGATTGITFTETCAKRFNCSTYQDIINFSVAYTVCGYTDNSFVVPLHRPDMEFRDVDIGSTLDVILEEGYIYDHSFKSVEVLSNITFTITPEFFNYHKLAFAQ
jgi:hypothetical protein